MNNEEVGKKLDNLVRSIDDDLRALQAADVSAKSLYSVRAQLYTAKAVALSGIASIVTGVDIAEAPKEENPLSLNKIIQDLREIDKTLGCSRHPKVTCSGCDSKVGDECNVDGRHVTDKTPACYLYDHTPEEGH